MKALKILAITAIIFSATSSDIKACVASGGTTASCLAKFLA